MKFKTLYMLLGEAIELGLVNNIYITGNDISWTFTDIDELGAVTEINGKLISSERDSLELLIEKVIEGRERWANYMI